MFLSLIIFYSIVVFTLQYVGIHSMIRALRYVNVLLWTRFIAKLRLEQVESGLNEPISYHFFKRLERQIDILSEVMQFGSINQ